MEILQHSLKKIGLESLSVFQLNVWNILLPLFKDLIFDQLSSKSSIEESLGIDVFLRLKKSDFVLYMSVSEDCFYINSKYFDIYIYPETELSKVELLVKQILLGKYSVTLGYDNNHKLAHKKMVFDSKRLKEFNENQKIGFWRKKIKYEEKIEGVRFIHD